MGKSRRQAAGAAAEERSVIEQEIENGKLAYAPGTMYS